MASPSSPLPVTPHPPSFPSVFLVTCTSSELATGDGQGKQALFNGCFLKGFLTSVSFPPTEKKDTVLRQVRLDPCDLQPIFDDMLHILNPEELHVIEEIPQAEDKLDRLFEIAGVKSQEASQTLLDSVYSHLPDLL